MLNPDFQDMLSALSEAGVDFIVVGAFALAAHGNPRATGDIDLLVRPSRENASRLMEALKFFGAPTTGIEFEDFCTAETVFQIGLPPRRIDLLTSLEGIADFDEAWMSRITVQIGGSTVPVIGRETLIKNKTALGRPQDVADVAWLLDHPPPAPP